ncbi:unnamed protein product [Chondrus crispus]|uniref:Uncharacterized protein n=1 Tax=Chondrus crispus TaxID=2769 RepID=R7Q998_CHOCR|nr:unnamed protein product [Chondrus crispus]CDF34035.1 unnamed protein product [Chondrus crispus]|eukprot:XP_005713854.1 unnamed protein product [Chondrus crispus]
MCEKEFRRVYRESLSWHRRMRTVYVNRVEIVYPLTGEEFRNALSLLKLLLRVGGKDPPWYRLLDRTKELPCDVNKSHRVEVEIYSERRSKKKPNSEQGLFFNKQGACGVVMGEAEWGPGKRGGEDGGGDGGGLVFGKMVGTYVAEKKRAARRLQQGLQVSESVAR